jgi:DNA topoisomerase-1
MVRKKAESKVTKDEALVVVESPAKAKTINKILGSHFKVKASMGHVRDLPSSEFGVDAEHDFLPRYVILPARKKIVNELKKAAKESNAIYLAPDPDREGEAIAWHLASIFEKNDKQVYRVAFNEITKNAVLEAFKNPHAIDMNKVDSQQARRILDRIVGYKISPLLWRKVGKGLSAGRVQSVAVRLICEREEEIRKFVPQEYWSVEAILQKQSSDGASFEARLDRIQGKKIEISNAQTAEEIVKDIESLKDTFVVGNLQSKDRSQKVPPPFITSQLQQASANTLKFSVQKTMKIAQELYEGIELGEEGSVGLITYMRTDSYKISQDALNEAKVYIENRFGKDYVPEMFNTFKSKKGAQEAHEAIRPTSVETDPEKIKSFLTPDQYKLYRLIWKRFLQSQMTPAQLKVHTVEIAVGLSIDLEKWQEAKYIFKATGTQVIFPGYLILEEPLPEDDEEEKDKDKEDEEKEVSLPELAIGEKLNLLKITPNQHFTKPPPRYNEASLVKALEEREIGRPSTYAPIIQTILKRDYVYKDRNKLIPTELGFTVTQLLTEHFPNVINVEFTAKMEADLDLIEEGKENWRRLLADFYKPFMDTVEQASKTMKTVKRDPIPTSEVCEKCGSMMVIRTGRYGKFMACSGFPKCRNVKPLDTGIACPKPGCTGKVVQRKSKRGKMFYGCTRYPECDFTASNLKQLETPGSPESPSSEKGSDENTMQDEAK